MRGDIRVGHWPTNCYSPQLGVAPTRHFQVAVSSSGTSAEMLWMPADKRQRAWRRQAVNRPGTADQSYRWAQVSQGRMNQMNYDSVILTQSSEKAGSGEQGHERPLGGRSFWVRAGMKLKQLYRCWIKNQESLLVWLDFSINSCPGRWDCFSRVL